MRILHLISSSGLFGAERVLLNIGTGLKDNNHECHLLCLGDSKKDVPEIHSEAQRIGLSSKVILCKHRIDMKALFEIKNFIRSADIQVIHSHGYKSDVYGFAASKMSGVPAIATLHGWTSETSAVRLYERLDKWVMRGMSRLVAVSPSIVEELKALGLNGGRVTFIPNGIDTGRFDPSKTAGRGLREEFGIEGRVVIGTVGRLSPEKGHINLIRALARIRPAAPDTRLLIVGDGVLKDELKREAENLGVGGMVIFTGVRDEMVSVYGAMDIFVLPSVREGLPLALLEAMSMELAVIAADVGAVRYVIRDDREGIVVPAQDPGLLAEKTLLLLKDAALRKGMGKRARESALSRFSNDMLHRRYLEVYEKVTAGGFTLGANNEN